RRPLHQPEHLLARPLGTRPVVGRQAAERLAQVQRRDQLRLPRQHGEAVAPPERPLTLTLSPCGGEGIGLAPSPSLEGEGWGEGGRLSTHNPVPWTPSC